MGCVLMQLLMSSEHYPMRLMQYIKALQPNPPRDSEIDDAGGATDIERLKSSNEGGCNIPESVLLSQETNCKSLKMAGHLRCFRDRNQLKPELFGPFCQRLHDPLAVAFFVVGLALVDILVTLRQQLRDQAGQLVGAGGDGAGLVHTGAQAPIVGAQGRLARSLSDFPVRSACTRIFGSSSLTNNLEFT